MSENVIDPLVFLQLKDRDFSSSSLEEIAKRCQNAYQQTKKYLDTNMPDNWLY